MKLVTFLLGGDVRLGAIGGESIVDLNRAYAALERSHARPAAQASADAVVPTEVVDFLALGDTALDAARAAIDYANALPPDLAARMLVTVSTGEAELLPPVPKPPKIICVARNYAEHAREAGLQISEIPIVFARFTDTLVAPGGPVIRPTVSEELDWEGELAVIIGKRGRHIDRDHAMEHIAGYSIFNDVTVRDYQFRVTQYTSGKNFAASGPFGPYLVLKDEVEDPHNLEITTEVNGTVKQRGNTSDMIYDLPTILGHISEWIALEPGDVIATGTPAGVGFKRTPPEFLRPGDVVSVTISGLGTLTNPVHAEQER
ncbi:MAG TPA: fumarylacetoacetate hydrolase family protein [Solirubrobacteraceae bacterium]|nr:fumarylacetoacetate hydrolase family protein [Solirubrobacteraceae bacterium]